MSAPHLVLSRRIRKTPFEQRVIERGATHFSVYNHMTLPLVFASLEEDYAHLCEHVQLWDVSSERQVEVSGPDAMRLCDPVPDAETVDAALFSAVRELQRQRIGPVLNGSQQFAV